MDGYWRLLRQRVSTRGYNTKRADFLRRAVRVHQWTLWAGPGADLFMLLGAALRAQLDQRKAARTPEDLSEEAARAEASRQRRVQKARDGPGRGGSNLKLEIWTLET